MDEVAVVFVSHYQVVIVFTQKPNQEAVHAAVFDEDMPAI